MIKYDTHIVLEKDDVNAAYISPCFHNASLEYSLSEIKIVENTKIAYKKFSQNSLTEAFERPLNFINHSTVTDLEFNVTLGKIAFVGTEGSKIKNINLLKSRSIKDDDLKPVYVTYLNSSFRNNFLTNIKESGFENYNGDEPEGFTIVHLFARKENSALNVRLALDKNLDEFKDEEVELRKLSTGKTKTLHAEDTKSPKVKLMVSSIKILSVKTDKKDM